jgi:NAD-dependent dihydropyrimidine dehydrogenase PreA subunit
VARDSSKAECKQDAGIFAPMIDRTRCEAKEDCVEACPYDVFEVHKLSDEDKRAIPLIARVKAWVHGIARPSPFAPTNATRAAFASPRAPSMRLS